ncbi:MAG: GAF domain-containing protein [Anaerolineae bacterium]|nr:GAF domain-containing protein [Anaerolineae bacterium]
MSMQEKKPETARSLAATLVIAFLSLTLAALLIAYIPQLVALIQAGNQAIDSQQQLVARKAANTVVSFIQTRFDVLETAAKLGDLASASRQDQEQVLANVLGLQPAFRQLVFLNSQGQELAGLSRLSQSLSSSPVDRAESGWFARIGQGERYISPVYVDDVTSEPLVIMAVPSRDVFGDLQGALLAEVNLKFMWDLVGRLEVGQTGLAYVVDGQGNLLAFGDVSRVLRGENIGQLDLVARFVNDPVPAGQAMTGAFQGIDGTRVVGTYVSLGVPDWAVVIELPVQEGTRPLIRSILTSIIMIVVVAVVVGLAAIYLARRLTLPLLNLTATAGRIAEGEIALQAAPQGPAEVVDLARAFNSMTAQLRETLAGLEQRVAERTQGLLTAAEVSRATTAVLDLDVLLPQVVELMQERFRLYYVGVFLVDETGENAVLRAGSGEAGRQMLARNWWLPVGGESMIGRCVISGQADIQLDVGDAAVRFDNPYLPDTRSELALPLRAGTEVLGAMTVQSEQEAFFSEEDVSVLQTVADQVANAVRNARLFQQVETSLEAERRAYGEMTREAWQNLLSAQPDLGFLSDRQKTDLAADLWRPEMQTTLHTGQQSPGSDGTTLAIPVRVRDQVVGVIDGRKPDGSAWTEDEIDLLSAMAEQLNVALEGAQLYRDAQRREARERLIAQAAARIREPLDLRAVLRTAADEIRQTLELDELAIRLVTSESLPLTKKPDSD